MFFLINISKKFESHTVTQNADFTVFIQLMAAKQDTTRHSQVCLKDTSANNSNQKYTKAEGKTSAFQFFVNDTSDQLKNGKVCDILNI